MTIARIFCNQTPYALPVGRHAGKNLRAFFRAEAEERCGEGEYDLFQQAFDPSSPDELVPDTDEGVAVYDGQKFYVVPRKINS